MVKKKKIHTNKTKNIYKRTHLNIPWLHVAEQWKENDDGKEDEEEVDDDECVSLFEAPTVAGAVFGFLVVAKDIFFSKVEICVNFFF